MIKRIIALILLLCLCGQTGAIAENMEIRLTLTGSDVLSDGAQRALAQWLGKAHLAVYTADDLQEIALYADDNALLSAVGSKQEGRISAGGYTAPLQMQQFSFSECFAQALSCAQQLGEELKAYEKSAAASAELGGAVKAKTQLSYALSQAEWAEVWPKVCAVLGEGLQEYALESKGTLRRYFDADGNEIGAYFYAEKVRIAENDVREVRLEYAFQAEKGLYVSFRCPNKNDTRNLRITLTAKRTERTDRISYTINADIRQKGENGQDTLLADVSFKETAGVFSGSAKINYTQKRGEKSVKYALEIKPDLKMETKTGTIDFSYDRAGVQVLAGEITLTHGAEKDIALPDINAQEAQVIKRLAYDLMLSLAETDPNERLELMYYLNRDVFLKGDEKDFMYDPELTATEETD